MEYDIVCKKINEVYLKIICDRGTAYELNDFFSFYVKGFQFHPKVKARLWDGKLRLFNLKTGTLYIGLLFKLIQFCKDREYTLDIDKALLIKNDISSSFLQNTINDLKLPQKYVLRDYQKAALDHFLKYEKMLLISPTGSGKSLTIYACIKSIISEIDRVLLVVPSISLVHQMYSDFESYGLNVEKYCAKIHAGQNKNSNKKIYISTWQSIYKEDVDYFNKFDAVIVDECHGASASSLTSLVQNCVNARYKIGATGSLDESKTNELALVGLFGSIFKATTTIDLMNNGQLSQLDIKCLVLKHELDASCKKWKYDEEVKYLIGCQPRNTFLKKLAESLKGNTLMLFNYVEKHGKVLYELLSDSKKKIYFIHGGIEVEERENIRKILEIENECIVLASYGTFSQGVNAPNIHNIIFASAYKSQVKVIQSIGRGLRLHINKSKAILYDVSDDLRLDKYVNHTLKHLEKRLEIYDKEKFNYKIYKIDLIKK